MQKNLTIIIPHFESNGKIEKMLNSINSNRKSDQIEVIIVDDQSNLKEIELLNSILNKYDKLSIKLINNNSNLKGAGKSRNIGIENCKTKWLFFADSDDYMLPNFFENMERYFNSNSDVVFFPPISQNDDGTKQIRHLTYLRYFSEYSIKGNEDGLRYQLAPVWTKMIKKSLIKKYNIEFENILSSNDVMFSLKVGIFAKNIEIADENIYSRVLNSKSITINRTKESFLSSVELAKRKNLIMRENLSKKSYKRNRPTMLVYLSSSLFRYKYGFKFTFRVLICLIKSHIIPFRFNEFSRVRNFFKNNRNYKNL